ncbi:MAG: hypothetical protein KA354_00685 [Phycisphaerae bacterium]|nr:hypothetical protein [Phycisphaerae bacterium]
MAIQDNALKPGPARRGEAKPDTPFYLKREPVQWPKDAFFYMLADGGGSQPEAVVYRCRNHPWFESSVPVPVPPGLALHRASLKAHWPLVPYRLTELALGFFVRVARMYNSESFLLLCYDRWKRRYRLICPVQRVTYSSVKYEVPDLPPEFMLVGDIHSHPGDDAGASIIDQWDERSRAMVHIIWAFPRHHPPHVQVDAVIDGHRFPIAADSILERGYRRLRLRVPTRWIDRVHKETYRRYVDSEETQECPDKGGSNHGCQSTSRPWTAPGS